MTKRQATQWLSDPTTKPIDKEKHLVYTKETLPKLIESLSHFTDFELRLDWEAAYTQASEGKVIQIVPMSFLNKMPPYMWVGITPDTIMGSCSQEHSRKSRDVP